MRMTGAIPASLAPSLLHLEWLPTIKLTKHIPASTGIVGGGNDEGPGSVDSQYMGRTSAYPDRLVRGVTIERPGPRVRALLQIPGTNSSTWLTIELHNLYTG